MKPMPAFAPYPRVSAPLYGRWLLMGAGLLTALGLNSWLASAVFDSTDVAEQRNRLAMTINLLLGLMLWLLALLVRSVFYRCNRHNALRYEQASARVLQGWWTQHRQTVALLEHALLGPACRTTMECQALFDLDHQPPLARQTAEGPMLQVGQLMGAGSAAREQELAQRLVMSWRAQRQGNDIEQPLHCYWQGSSQAWAAFAAQMAICFPALELPALPEPWQGQASLDLIIDQLNRAPGQARILCAGCESSIAPPGSAVPAGEAAVLWVLGHEGGVRLTRGEWLAPQADAEAASALAARALLQGELGEPPVSVGFAGAQRQQIGWQTRHYLQEANFGDLPNLQAMVALTLAASYVSAHAAPCAWLAIDPLQSMTLGVVRPDDSA